MAFSVDAQGDLRDPNLHDGFLDGIHLLDERTLRVSLRDLRSQRFVMDLVGLEGLVGNDFRQSNIIFTVRITSGSGPDLDTLGSVFEAPHASAAAEFQDRHARFLESHADRIKEGVLSLVCIVLKRPTDAGSRRCASGC